MKKGLLLVLPLLFLLLAVSANADNMAVQQLQCNQLNAPGVGVGKNFGQSFIWNHTNDKLTNWEVPLANGSYVAGQTIEVRLCTGESACTGGGSLLIKNFSLPAISASTGLCTSNTTINLTLDYTGMVNGGNYSLGIFLNHGSGQIAFGETTSNVYSYGKRQVNGVYSAGNDMSLQRLWSTVSSTPGVNFSVTAQDRYDLNAINTFNATINGTNGGTTLGRINTTIPTNTGLVNITVVNATNYFTNATLNYNTSSNYTANLTPYTRVYAVYIIGGTTILNFSINYTNSTGTYSTSTQTGTVHLPLYNETWNLTIYNANNNGQNYSTANASFNGTASALTFLIKSALLLKLLSPMFPLNPPASCTS